MLLSTNKIGCWLLLFLQGMIIGTGAILPGISGGVLCVAFGIYEPMMDFLEHPIQSLKRRHRLFVPILLGGIVGFVLLAKLVESFLDAYAVLALALFSGLICGTIPGLMKKSTASCSKKGWSAFIITLAFSYVFFRLLNTGIEGTLQANFGWYIFCGAIWGLSMIIPGLSSSSILLFMGLYQPMAEGIGNLDPVVIIPLLIGFVITIVAASKIINKLLKHHYNIMSKIILGFMISSVLMILPTHFNTTFEILLSIVCFMIGFGAAHWMDSFNLKQHQE